MINKSNISLKHLVTSLLFCFAIFFSACGGGSSSNNDRSAAGGCDAFRVINGESCTSDDIPTVLLEISTGRGSGECTGTLISNDFILTAAHCLFPGGARSVRVVHGRRVQDADAFAVSPQYQSSGGQNNAFDVALIQANGFAAGASVNPATIGATTSVNRGDRLAFIGYGEDNNGNTGTDLPGENPQGAFVEVAEVRDGLIINTFEGTGSNPCFGDSGGAAIKDGKIVGIESGGTTESCRDGDINLFAAISNSENLSFIRSFVPNANID